MKKTVFTDIHESMGAKMGEFAGYNMPLFFEGVSVEHNIVRKKVGVFDVSHMGEIWIKGPNAFELAQRISTNNIADLYDGKVQYSCFPNETGGIIDDFLAYRINEETYLFVVNASNIKKVWDWIESQNHNNAEIYNASMEISQLAVQGPLALQTVQKLVDEPILDMPYYTFKKLQVAGVKDVILSITGYTGSGGCELYFANEDGVHIYNKILEAGAEFGIKPIGLAARDTLRLEAGFCLYGNDINDETSPIEAGLGWITKFVGENKFINREYHEALKRCKPQRYLRGFKLIDKGVPRQHYEICDENKEVIGEVTSGTLSPYTSEAIGLCYVRADKAAYGNEVFVKVRNKMLKAKLVKPPFFT